MFQEPQNNIQFDAAAVPERILRMRELNLRPGGIGNFLPSDARLFYIQGRFLADFEDHYNQYAPLFDSQPTYESMSDNQLRYYFTWRSSVRKRRSAGTGVYYIYLYFFELMNNIGVDSGAEALEQMAYVVNAYKNSLIDSIPLFKTWFRDYYAMNNITASFSEIIRRLGLDEFFPIESYEQEFKYAYTLRISGFAFYDDPFIAGFGSRKFIQCYNAVMNNLSALFKMYGLDMDSLFEGAYNSDNSWFPYERAIFYGAAPDKDRVVRLNRSEQYVCVRGVWNRRVISYDPAVVSLVELIIGKIAAALYPANSGAAYPQPARYENARKALRNTPFTAVINDSYFDEIIGLTMTRCLQPACSGEFISASADLADLLKQPGSEAVKAIWRARAVPAASGYDMEIARQFVSQARILADCTDDYDADQPPPDLSASKYTYSMLTIPQTRQYLTWRAGYKAKPSVAPPAFANIYASELINKIGAESDLDVLEKLAGLTKHAPEISGVFLDYYITHAGALPFAEVIKRFGISGYFPHIAIQNRSWEDWYGLFSDKLDFRPEPEIADAFNLCVKNLRDYFENAGLTFMVLFLGMDSGRRSEWTAFSRAVYSFDYRGCKADINVSVSDYDVYAFNTSYRRWVCLSASMINPKSYYLIGYVIKRLTGLLRGQKLPNIQLKRVKSMFPPLPAYLKYISAVTCGDFDNIIDNTYKEYIQTAVKRVKVSVDVSLLDNVRRAADENLEKLSVDYDDAASIIENTIAPPAAETGWNAFINALNNTQRRALASVLEGKTGELHNLAQTENMLAEVLIESINEIALAYTEDYIIENTDEGPKIFEEYAEALRGDKLCYG